MTEKLPLNQNSPTTKEIEAYLRKPKFRIFKKLIDSEQYLEIKPDPEIKTYQIPATDKDPEKEIITYLYSDGKTVTKTTYYWGKYLNVNF
jgi:hypothetical protein